MSNIQRFSSQDSLRTMAKPLTSPMVSSPLLFPKRENPLPFGRVGTIIVENGSPVENLKPAVKRSGITNKSENRNFQDPIDVIDLEDEDEDTATYVGDVRCDCIEYKGNISSGKKSLLLF